jgi:mevalonate kinase
MVHCVNLAKQALAEDAPDSLFRLAEAINTAADCFFQWGLISESLQHHMQTLFDAGALAVKPTGSGGGGFVVSLWENPPPTHLPIEFIAV